MRTLQQFAILAFALFIYNNSFAGAPNGSFTVSPGTTVTPGTNVCFTNTTTGSGNTYSWTNNSVVFSTATSPCLVFPTAGSYNVCLTATNTNGTDTSPACQTIVVSDALNIGVVNGTTVNSGCGLLLEDAGGAADYGNNQNHTVTFCSGNTNFISMALGTLTLGAGDVLQFYAGTGTGGTLLSTLTSAQNGTTPTIYANNTCITVSFVSDGSGVAAGFSMQALCYANNQIIMGTPNSSNYANACGMSIFDPGYNSNYGNNQSYTTTICASSAAQVPQILFNSFQLGAGDQVNFYDGSTTTGQLLYSGVPSDNVNNSFITPGLTVTGISQCMTVQFISNGATVSGGMNGSISCETPPTPCNSNPVAADNFDAATMICDFSQYCGVTSSFYGVDMPNIDQTAVFDGSFENNSWLMFVADAATASFTVATQSASCYIQIGIYSYNQATGAFTWLSPESINGGFDYTNVDTGFAGTGTLNAQGMTPGNTYYILIDGHGGSVCNYTLTAGIGVQLPVALASPDLSLDCDEPGSVSVTNTNGSANVDWTWTWTGSSSGGPVSGSTVDVSSLNPGTYNFTVEATDFNSCVTTAIQDQVQVTIDPCPLNVELISFYGLPSGDHNEILWTTLTEINNSHFILERSIDGQNWEPIYYRPGSGTSSEELRYEFDDFTYNSELSYYRLVQYDFNGLSTIHDVISVLNKNQEKGIIKIINLIGQEVKADYTGPRIIHYNDGSTKKIIGD